MDNCMPASRSFLSILTGSFSTPSAQNPTVAMIEAAYRHHKIDARYLNCEVSADGLKAAVAGAVAMNWVGFNCSLPHKIKVMDHLDALDRTAGLIGAVNCVSIADGRLTGHNTDGEGFMKSLRAVIDPAGKTLLLLGAGGAARAIAVEAALAGVRMITVVNRDFHRAESFARDITAATTLAVDVTDRPEAVGADIIVNATPVGQYPKVEETPTLAFAAINSKVVVADVIPNPPRTRFLRDAAARGCPTLDGLGMLVNQAVASLNHWIGLDPDPGVMRRELETIFGL